MDQTWLMVFVQGRLTNPLSGAVVIHTVEVQLKYIYHICITPVESTPLGCVELAGIISC